MSDSYCSPKKQFISIYRGIFYGNFFFSKPQKPKGRGFRRGGNLEGTPLIYEVPLAPLPLLYLITEPQKINQTFSFSKTKVNRIHKFPKQIDDCLFTHGFLRKIVLEIRI